MKLSAGAEAAWLIAAGEATASGHDRIEPGHLLVGVLSLGKLEKHGAWRLAYDEGGICLLPDV